MRGVLFLFPTRFLLPFLSLCPLLYSLFSLFPRTDVYTSVLITGQGAVAPCGGLEVEPPWSALALAFALSSPQNRRVYVGSNTQVKEWLLLAGLDRVQGFSLDLSLDLIS